jgi:hypothetical protein
MYFIVQYSLAQALASLASSCGLIVFVDLWVTFDGGGALALCAGVACVVWFPLLPLSTWYNCLSSPLVLGLRIQGRWHIDRVTQCVREDVERNTVRVLCDHRVMCVCMADGFVWLCKFTGQLYW